MTDHCNPILIPFWIVIALLLFFLCPDPPARATAPRGRTW